MQYPRLNTRPSRCSGFTLIELLTSLVIGLLIMTAATSLAVTSADSRRLVKLQSELQDNSFFISQLLKQQFAQIGYRPIDLSGDARAMPIRNVQQYFPIVTGEWTQGQVLKVTGNTLSFRFDGASNPDGTPDGSVFDCLGNAVAAGTIIETDLSIQDNNLDCTIGTDSERLADDIEQMIITLGVDNNNDGSIDNVVDSAAASEADFSNAVKLNVNLLLRTRDNLTKTKKTYRFNGADIVATDNRLRKEVAFSVALRN